MKRLVQRSVRWMVLVAVLGAGWLMVSPQTAEAGWYYRGPYYGRYYSYRPYTYYRPAVPYYRPYTYSYRYTPYNYSYRYSYGPSYYVPPIPYYPY